MRTAVALLAALLLLGACAGVCGGASSPVVGHWTFKGGVVDIQPSGGGFQGVITQRPTDSACPEPVGYVLLKLSGSGNHYTGSEEWWLLPDCSRVYSNTATFDLSGASARLCSRDPFPGGGETECVSMARLANS